MARLLHNNQKGATSLFIVIFATVLFSVITVGFLSLMINDQRRATDSEWSEGAYDSALAGVEDAKRVLAMCRDNAGSAACAAIEDERCSTISDAGLVTAIDGEVLLQSQDGGGTLSDGAVNQAYTCVVIRRDTPDYKGKLERDESVLIPLESGNQAYDQVILKWFNSDNAETATFGAVGDTTLPELDEAYWPATRPPIMRTQFMQYDRTDIQLEDFDMDSYSHTAFLLPTDRFGNDTVNIATDDQRNPGTLDEPAALSRKNSPKPVYCQPNLQFSYACEVVINLPDMDRPVSAANKSALLRLTALYGGTSYTVQMRNSTSGPVNFVGVQPSIDSTGRAGDVFRRVDARVDMSGAGRGGYPRATIDVTRDLCKNFTIGAGATPWECG